jgi:hypothetical protein
LELEEGKANYIANKFKFEEELLKIDDDFKDILGNIKIIKAQLNESSITSAEKTRLEAELQRLEEEREKKFREFLEKGDALPNDDLKKISKDVLGYEEKKENDELEILSKEDLKKAIDELDPS